MGFKSFVILVVAVCAIKCTTALPPQEALKQSRDLQEDLKNLIDDLAEFTEETVGDIAKLLESTIDHLQIEGKKFSKNLEKNLQEALQKIDDLIAEAGGKDISKCTDPNLKEITKIHFNAVIAVDGCHDDAKAEGREILLEAKASMPDVAGEAKRLLDEFFACTNLFCRTKVLAKATIKKYELTNRIGAVAAKANLDLSDSNIRGVFCMKSAANSAKEQIVKILVEIVKCVMDLSK